MMTFGPVTRRSVLSVSAHPQPAQALWPDANKSSSAAIYIPSGRMAWSSLYHSSYGTFSPFIFAKPFFAIVLKSSTVMSRPPIPAMNPRTSALDFA